MRALSRSILVSCCLLLMSLPVFAEVHVIKFNHKNGSGDDKNIAAIDLNTGKVRWEKKLKQEVNFVVDAEGGGVLVGSDDGNLYQFRVEDGTLVWTAKLGEAVNVFQKVFGDAYLVSSHQEVYWLVAKDGKLRASWK